jgi:hypothetical protein
MNMAFKVKNLFFSRGCGVLEALHANVQHAEELPGAFVIKLYSALMMSLQNNHGSLSY